MRRNVNHTTQPFLSMPIFQNWDVIAEAWYYVCPSKDIGLKQARSMMICGQHLVFYRGEDGKVRAMDGFCPHMGTDLGIGKVVGNRLRCFFHHWEFDGSGTCQHIPCGEKPPKNARLHTYAAREKYGAIWVYPKAHADCELPTFEDMPDEALTIQLGRPYERACHHHVTMINGIDPQHLRTVHNLNLDMDIEIREKSAALVDFSLKGELPQRTVVERLIRRVLGAHYGYAMRYGGGTIGLLTLAQHARLFWRAFPRLTMVFAYRPLEQGKTLVQPIFVTRKRPGFFGKLKSRLVIWLTKRAFYALQGEDGKVYDNMRFNPQALIAIDRPVAVFMHTINKLRPSIWSRS